MIAIGIDPDTFATGMAVVDTRTSRVLAVASAQVRRADPVEKRIVHMATVAAKHIESLRQEVWNLPGAPLVEAIVVEGQKKYPRDKVRPNDLIHLAQVAGGCLAAARMTFPLAANVVVPDPQAWKGQVPKAVFTRRILGKIGHRSVDSLIESGIPGTERLTVNQLGHVIDAIGLALHAATSRRRIAG